MSLNLFTGGLFVANGSSARSSLSDESRHRSPWTFRQNAGRFLWGVAQQLLFRFSPRLFYRWRNWILRLFGARIHPSARIWPTVRIEVPWTLTVGANSAIGHEAILYCLGPVILGDRVTVSQYAHLCAGTHDYTNLNLPLLRPAITLEHDVWIAADVFVGPGVRVGQGTVVGARSSVFRDLPAWKVCVGSPAKPIKDRSVDPS